jgi:hypothetical protein
MLRIIACLVLSLTLLTGPALAQSQSRERASGDEIANGRTVTRDGITYQQAFWPNGQLQSEEPIVKGTIHGIGYYFWDNGMQYGAIPYVMGRKHGTFTLYRPDGSAEQKLSYKDGALNGVSEWYNETGQVYAKWDYRDGQAVQDLLAGQGKQPVEPETRIAERPQQTTGNAYDPEPPSPDGESVLMPAFLSYLGLFAVIYALVRNATRHGRTAREAGEMAPKGSWLRALLPFSIIANADALKEMAEKGFAQLAEQSGLEMWQLQPSAAGADADERWDIEGPAGPLGQLVWRDEIVTVTLPDEAEFHFKRGEDGIAVTQSGETIGQIALKPNNRAVLMYKDLQVLSTDKSIGAFYMAEFHSGKDLYACVMAISEGEPIKLGIKSDLIAAMTAMIVAHARFAALS